MASSPPKKKTKYDVEPGVLSGAKSASELAKGEDSDAAFTIHPTPLTSFFPRPASVQNDESDSSAILREANSQNLDMTVAAMTSLRFALSEKAYRNGIYRQLTGKKYNLETVPGTRKRFSYEEMNLIGLFLAFVDANAATDKISAEERDELSRMLRRKEHGLKLTTTSLPDFAFLRYVNGSYEFVLGEVKHASCYSRQNAMQKAVCYLQALLYFLRVKLGLPVTTIYGFALCGSKCSGIQSSIIRPRYAVGFMKMTAPTTLDGRCVVQSYWKEFGAFDSSGLKLLIHFLKCGNSYQYDRIGMTGTNVWGLRRDLGKRCPSLFIIPVSLWEDTADRQLVLNGTLAAVFQVSQHGATQLLEMIAENEDPSRHATRADTLIGRAFLELLNGLDFKDEMVYVKIHTTETVQHLMSSSFSGIWDVLLAAGESSSAIADFFQTYPLKPPTFSKCSFIVMYDRGESLRHADLSSYYKNFSVARPELRELKSDMEELAEFCFHGDMLPHNVGVIKGKLTLFDYDEALPEESDPPRRVIPDQVNVYRRLSYPNILRTDHKKEYSYIQFSLIVRFMAESLDCSASESTNLMAMCSCHDELADMLDFDVLTDELQLQILPKVTELVAIVDSILY